MATTIKLKNSVTTTAAPSTLVQGEAAVNITDKKVWVGDASSSPVQIIGAGAPVSGTTGTFTGNVSVAGTFSANGGATLGDASGDALTINSSAVSIPNGLNFDSNTFVIDATNNYVGIGTSSPAYKLDIVSSGLGTYPIVARNSANGATIFKVGNASNGNGTLDILGGNGTSVALSLDSSGNLGLGVTPSAWKSTYKALQIGNTTSIVNVEGYSFFVENAYFNSADTPIYLKTLPASYYRQDSGAHKWYNAPSGTAGNAITFTQAMTLDASGELLVGTTTGASGGAIGVSVINSSGGGVQVGYPSNGGGAILGLTGGGQGFYTYTGAQGSESYSERMRIDSSGNLLVGLTSATSGGGVLQVSNGITFPATQSASSNANTLDDYEEGTWTPTLAGASSVSLTLHGSQTYIKIGKFVTLFYDFNVASNSVGSQATLSGFPFTVASTNPEYTGGGFNNFAGGLIGGTNYNMNWLCNGGSTGAGANYNGAGSPQVPPSAMSTFRFIGQISYLSSN